MLVNHEAILSALFELLVASVVVSFTGDTTEGSSVVANLSATAGLFVGLPVFGAGVPSGAMVDDFDPVAMTLTLSQNATASATAVPLKTGFRTTGRRVKRWTEVSEQPALFLRLTADEDVYPNIIISKTTLEAEIWVYSQAGRNPDAVPGIALSGLVDAIRAALKPDNRMLQQLTLGGLVNSCRIEGRTVFDPGDLDGQAKAVLPIKILCP